MVKAKDDSELLKHDNIHVEQWIAYLVTKGYTEQIDLLRDVFVLTQLTGAKQPTDLKLSCFQIGLVMIDILADLQVDIETLAAALLYPELAYSFLSLEDIEKQFGHSIAKILKGVLRMGILSTEGSNTKQVENIRKMLLVMVDDVRVVLVKLAERLCVLRESQQLDNTLRRSLAKEAMNIYAPLAHRLGVGLLKWEIEDLAFRYLEPIVYKEIATGLKIKRVERDKYVKQIIDLLTQSITQHNITDFTVYGRSKNIYSIYRKMKLKHLYLEEIHDATAVRILVNNIEDCYAVLSVVHELWLPVPQEFDDYISKPKPNGYQSLHTAVIGPKKRLFEIQIRTYSMHEFAEMGIAAHWKYKEGVGREKPGYERKIAWLREVLAWHKELSIKTESQNALEQDILDDRVYVFTPQGDVLDLPMYATVLDFAYRIHTSLGHRCRGAKVNGKMVPLNFSLKTGDRVEVLTTKEEKPSRDWLNPHLHYLMTSRAKAKVLHWFKMQDYDLHMKEGLTPSQPISITPPKVFFEDVKSKIKPGNLYIEGIGRLLTNVARCCNPVLGDEVIGYITVGRGVSIHRQDCKNILHASERQRKRFLAVNWAIKAD